MCSWWPARLPALCLPSFKAEERARVSNRDMDDLNMEELSPLKKVLELQPTVCSGQRGGQDGCLLPGKGRLQL